MTSNIGEERSIPRPWRRPALLAPAAGLVLVLLTGCPGKVIPGLAPTTCAASDLVITLTGAKENSKGDSGHTDQITVTVTCKTTGKPVPNAAVQVTWPGGSTTVGTTDSTGAPVTVSSSLFPTTSGPGPAVVSVNGSDDKSQSEKTDIP